MPKRVERWKCDICGEEFDLEKDCIRHEEIETLVLEGNKMLINGYTLKEINDKLHLWHALPTYLENATKDHCFIISHWQCCQKPAYQIIRLHFTGGAYGSVKLSMSGCGSWTGYYGGMLDINSYHLRTIHDPSELYIDKRAWR